MIRTDIDIKDFVYGIVKNSDLANEISGGIYKGQRPLNSELEDIVISVLARDASQNQYAIVNVNVYVPDIKVKNDLIEDTARLRLLCRLSADLLEYGSLPESRFELQSQGVDDTNDDKFHCINNRLMLRFNNE